MELINTSNKTLGSIEFTSEMLLLDSQKILSHYLYVPLDEDFMQHEDLQRLYSYVSNDLLGEQQIDYGFTEGLLALFIPYDSDGVMNFSNTLLYPFSYSLQVALSVEVLVYIIIKA